LDPEPPIAEYRDRYTTETSPGMRLQSMRDSGVLASKEPRRRGWLPLGIGCVLVVLVLGVWSMVAGRGDPASAPTVAAPETTLAPTPSTTLPPTTAPTTTLVSDEVEVVLRFEARSWASVKVDGEQAFRGVLSKGAERSFTGQQAVDVSLGNGGGVLLTVNGTDLGKAGPYGRAFQRTFTAQRQEPASGDGQETGQTSSTEATRATVGTTRQYTQTTNATRTTTRTRTTRTTRVSDSGDADDEFDADQPGSGGGRRKATTTTTEPDDDDEHDE
jgi:hypothetical protein